ncbi:MAG: SH3 domain-containing protein [Bacillota bacterium]
MVTIALMVAVVTIFQFVFCSLIYAVDYAPIVYYPVSLNNFVAVPEFADVTWSMKQPDYWIAKIVQPRALMFDDAQIQTLNAKLRADKDSYLADFEKYPAQLGSAKVADLVKRMSIPSELKYVNGKRVSYDYYKALDYNRNLDAIANPVVVKYGFTVRQTDMRSLPTADRIYNNAVNDSLDRFQETRLDPVEPLLILHSSRDGKWLFVQSVCYAAWVNVNDVAIVDSRSAWDNYRKSKFLSIKVPNFCMKNTQTNEVLVWEMGAKIPLASSESRVQSLEFSDGNSGLRTNNSELTHSNSGLITQDSELYIVQLPARDSIGKLIFQYVKLPKQTEGIREGFLPCSYQNIIYQAFKMYGMKFGWGGLYDSVDCSSFAQNVYRSFGIYIPRNSGQQAKMPVTTKEFYGIGGQRYEELTEVSPGSILYMPGHIMIYLGVDKNKNYIIHSFSSFGVLDKKRGIEENPVYAVAVTSMSIYRMSGRTFQDAVNVGKTIQ